jgi:hypothetical protein
VVLHSTPNHLDTLIVGLGFCQVGKKARNLKLVLNQTEALIEEKLYLYCFNLFTVTHCEQLRHGGPIPILASGNFEQRYFFTDHTRTFSLSKP